MVGMALAIGMLLDNSVVVLENIYRLRAAGASNEQAVTEGTKEVWRSIFAATLTHHNRIYSVCIFIELPDKTYRKPHWCFNHINPGGINGGGPFCLYLCSPMWCFACVANKNH